MKLRYDKDKKQPYIELDDDLASPLLGDNEHTDLMKTFVEQGEKGIILEKTCEDKYCKRHYRIIPNN